MTTPWRGRQRAATRRRGLLGTALALAIMVLVLVPAGGLPEPADALPFVPPGLAHPFGTDDLGRDLLREVARGVRTSLVLGGVVTATALVLGVALGLAAGMGSTLTDELLMRSADVVASLPTLIIAILVAALFGGSIAALVLGLTRWPLVARLVRMETASLRNRDFVLVARALGATRLRVTLLHVLPHAATAALAATGILFGGALVSEAALAFVGLGDPAVPSLGQLAANGFVFVSHAPWMWMAPAAAIVALTVAIAVLADRPSPCDWAQ